MDRTKSRGAMWGLLALVVAIGLMGSALAGGSALAAKNPTADSKGHHGGGTTTGATLTVSPNPVPAGTPVTVTGSGFKPGQQVWTGVVGFISHLLTADSNGSVSFIEDRQFLSDTYTVSAYTEGGSSWTMAASTTFFACATNPC